jgi:GxxExxY protein
MMRVGLFILNHEALKDRKEKIYRYKEAVLFCGYRADLLVDGCILVENKTVDAIHPVHQAQLITYLKLSGGSIGFLLSAYQAWHPAHDLAKR